MDMTTTDGPRTGSSAARASLPIAVFVAIVTAGFAGPSHATDGDDVRILDARARWETLNQIRQDKGYGSKYNKIDEHGVEDNKRMEELLGE